MSTNGECLTCRRILSVMIILAFIMYVMLKANLSIAIVPMSIENPSWDERRKNDILGCFFWGHTISPIIGGRLSEIYGAKKILGYPLLLSSILTLLTPVISSYHVYGLIVVRTVLGLLLGLMHPSVRIIAANWVPPRDRAKFYSNLFGSALGIVIIFPISGYLITYLGWSSIFYLTGTIGLIWAMFWFYLIYDSPSQHPRITQKEEEELRSCIKGTQLKSNIPWVKILTCWPVWAIIITQACFLFNYNLSQTHLPLYMNEVLKFNIEENGFMSCLPHLATYGIAKISSWLGDKWYHEKKFSLTNIRKIFTTLALGGPMLLFLIQAFLGDSRTVSITVFVLWLACYGLVVPGFISNSADITPLFAGTIAGFANTIGSLVSYFATKLIAVITEAKQDFQHWRYVFFLLSGINLLGIIVYLVFASAELQDWNPRKNEAEEEQLEKNQLNEIK